MNRTIAHKGNTGDSYAGIPIHCERGVHEFVFDRVRRTVKAHEKIVELGAGSGAMTQRLLDHGFAHVTAVDISSQGWSVAAVPVTVIDLNSPDWAGQIETPADAILAIEIIEHLENPTAFLKQCAAALAPGGHMFVTTPNLVSAASVMYAARFAEHLYFQREAFYSTGHRSPVLLATMLGMAEEAGLESLEVATCGKMRGLSVIKRAAVSVSGALRIHKSRHLDGAILYAHFRRR